VAKQHSNKRTSDKEDALFDFMEEARTRNVVKPIKTVKPEIEHVKAVKPEIKHVKTAKPEVESVTTVKRKRESTKKSKLSKKDLPIDKELTTVSVNYGILRRLKDLQFEFGRNVNLADVIQNLIDFYHDNKK